MFFLIVQNYWSRVIFRDKLFLREVLCEMNSNYDFISKRCLKRTKIKSDLTGNLVFEYQRVSIGWCLLIGMFQWRKPTLLALFFVCFFVAYRYTHMQLCTPKYPYKDYTYKLFHSKKSCGILKTRNFSVVCGILLNSFSIYTSIPCKTKKPAIGELFDSHTVKPDIPAFLAMPYLNLSCCLRW